MENYKILEIDLTEFKKIKGRYDELKINKQKTMKDFKSRQEYERVNKTKTEEELSQDTVDHQNAIIQQDNIINLELFNLAAEYTRSIDLAINEGMKKFKETIKIQFNIASCKESQTGIIFSS